MKPAKHLALIALSALICASTSGILLAQEGAVTPEIINSLSAPTSVDTRIGTLEFKDGMPSAETVGKAYDYLDFAHAVDVYINTFQGASLQAFREGLLNAGVEDNEMIIWPKLMDSNTLLLTANADVVYYIGFVDLTKGPMVVETPPDALGTIDDMWFNYVVDFGKPGTDRGAGGKYLILPPGYDGPVPQAGFNVARSGTTRVWVAGRNFLVDGDPKPAADLVQKTLRIYPYVAGGFGTSIAEILAGTVKPGKDVPPPSMRFVDGSGVSLNTIPPSDYSFFEMMDRLVQQEPAGALDAERMGQLASIGIVKGKPFAPDERMKKILTEAAAAGMAVSRTLAFKPRESEGFAYYPGSAWTNGLWLGGYTMETPPPMVTPQGVKPFPPTGARTLNARTAMFYYATGITPAMIMRLTGIGSQYLYAFVDADKNDLDGGKTYEVTLPRDIPEDNFWSFTLYDNQTRSMLQTPQGYPRAGSQNYPSPAAEADADGSTTVYFGPVQPEGVKRGNWIQTMPGKGYNVMLRLYSPLEPFFTKKWRPSEIVLTSLPAVTEAEALPQAPIQPLQAPERILHLFGREMTFKFPRDYAYVLRNDDKTHSRLMFLNKKEQAFMNIHAFYQSDQEKEKMSSNACSATSSSSGKAPSLQNTWKCTSEGAETFIVYGPDACGKGCAIYFGLSGHADMSLIAGLESQLAEMAARN